jgi:hypothetical protein
MAEISRENRLQIRRAIRWSLRSESWRPNEVNGVSTLRYDNKLEGLMAYGLVRNRMPKQVVRILQLHYGKGVPLEKIAFSLKMSIRQVIRYLNQGLDIIIDNAPTGIIVSLCPNTFNWLLKGCRRCGGDLYWDSEGAHGEDGEYCCILCGERYTVEEMEVKAPEKRG